MLNSLRQRRFYGSRFYGDGSYPSGPPSFVLTDRTTGTMYRVTAPGRVLTFVPITALASTDKREDFMTVQSLYNPAMYYNVYINNGSLVIETAKSYTRPAYIQDGATRYIIKHTYGLGLELVVV